MKVRIIRANKDYCVISNTDSIGYIVKCCIKGRNKIIVRSENRFINVSQVYFLP